MWRLRTETGVETTHWELKSISHGKTRETTSYNMIRVEQQNGETAYGT